MLKNLFYQVKILLKKKTSRNLLNRGLRGLIVKTILFLLVFFLGIFLLDKIDFPAPKKFIKQEISNDKLITLK